MVLFSFLCQWKVPPLVDCIQAALLSDALLSIQRWFRLMLKDVLMDGRSRAHSKVCNYWCWSEKDSGQRWAKRQQSYDELLLNTHTEIYFGAFFNLPLSRQLLLTECAQKFLFLWHFLYTETKLMTSECAEENKPIRGRRRSKMKIACRSESCHCHVYLCLINNSALAQQRGPF